MKYGYRIIGRAYYSEWNFDYDKEAKEESEKMVKLFENIKIKEIFKKRKDSVETVFRGES